MRIVSLLASATEIVCRVGASDSLVGRSHECDNPGWVRALPSCTRPAFDVYAPSRQIDAEVRRRLKAGEPLYHIDTELIRALKPDLLIAQEHCQVCAVTPEDVVRAGGESLAQRILALGAGTVEEIYHGIAAVGKATNRESAAAVAVSEMRRRIDDINRAVSGKRAPTVILLEWTDPIFLMSNWVPELVEAANGQLLLGASGEHSHAIGWDHVREADPDFLVIAPCGYDLDRSLREAPALEALPGWFELSAVRQGRVVFGDGNKFFNRSGTTIVETAEMIAEILHGACARKSWEGSAWRRYSDIDRSATRREAWADAALISPLSQLTQPRNRSEASNFSQLWS